MRHLPENLVGCLCELAVAPLVIPQEEKRNDENSFASLTALDNFLRLDTKTRKLSWTSEGLAWWAEKLFKEEKM
jgi:hypothetical protein